MSDTEEVNGRITDALSDSESERESEYEVDGNESDLLVKFQDLGISSWLQEALEAMSIRAPTEIQRHCIRPILEGRDVIGGAKTGSGKTAAFALPILQKLSEDPYGVFAVVLTPTRELAFQISEQFRVLGKGINLKECVVVGGLDMMSQALALSRRPHVIIATPGRLRDHIRSSANAVNLSRCRFLVLDEADRLLSDTFADDLEVILNEIPEKRQTLLFTATISDSILALKESAPPAKKPFVYRCDTSVSTVSTLSQFYVFIPSQVREHYLTYLLRSEEFGDKSTIIFCGKCATAEHITVMLKELGIKCTSLHSELTQQQRLDSLGRFRAEVVKILIATDVGSRGLDIPTVQTVINYDIPRDPTDYIHRVGRTARAGRGGQAVSIVSERDIELVHAIEARTNKEMEEYKVNDNKIIEILQEVSTAKRVANMQLHDSNFGERKRIQQAKKRASEEDATKRKKRKRGGQKLKQKMAIAQQMRLLKFVFLSLFFFVVDMSADEAATNAKSEQVADMQKLLDEGTKAFALQEYEESMQKFGQACEILDKTYGELSPMCGDAYFLYGRALLHYATQQNSVLGNEATGQSAANEVKEEPESVISNPRFHFEGEPDLRDPEDPNAAQNEEKQKEADGENQADAAAQNEDDFAYAWEILDIARVIYAKQEGKEAQLKLADVLMYLGDISLETEKFDQAVTDFREALKVKTELLDDDDRQLAEAHYKLALALEFQPTEAHHASEHIEKAMNVFQRRIERLQNDSEDHKGKGKQAAQPSAANQAEIIELKDMLPELDAKLEELRQLKTLPKTEDILRELLCGKSQTSSSDANTAKNMPVNDLTSLIKSKRKGADANGTSNQERKRPKTE
ncbi:hypothetical protein BZG36_02576 [Bifiguratus adelaidae]|uniref:Uncharacterized protein n=1 Tax=Bifiguratus adelaidae TaxID=1938954 RepID=A0A261Y123_9FUNG|nr:hypothetical protein BZG36_02576 [Bifiguratus adelaidae]